MVDERNEDGDVVDKFPKVKVRLEDGSIVTQPLPPIGQIVIPKTKTQSNTIRWLAALGYEVKDISAQLGTRYQQVRNIVTTIPKRAAREDLPDLVVEYKPEADPFDDAMDGALEASLLAGRKERQKENREMRRAEGLED